MQNENKQEIQELFKNLDKYDQKRLLETLLQEYELQEHIIEKAKDIVLDKPNKKPCPHCQSQQVQKRGKQKSVQMYQCKVCKKWYS